MNSIRLSSKAFLLICLLAFSSCSVLKLIPEPDPTKKEIRRMKRANKKLAKLLIRFPELKRTDTLVNQIPVIFPERIGRIETGRISYPVTEGIQWSSESEPIPEIPPPENFYIDFNDPFLSARFSMIDGTTALDYTIHEQNDTITVKTPCPTIQPTLPVEITKPLTWFQILWIRSGQIAWGVLLMLIIWWLIRKRLNTF